MCSWVLINHRWPRLKKTVLIGNDMWSFTIFLLVYWIWFTKAKQESLDLWSFHCWITSQGWVLGTYCVCLFSTLTSVFAVAHYYGWVLLWFISDPVLKVQFKKRPTLITFSQPERKSILLGFPQWLRAGLDELWMRWCVVDVTWPYGCGFTAGFTWGVAKSIPVLSLSQKPLDIKVSILLPILALLFSSGPGCVPG